VPDLAVCPDDADVTKVLTWNGSSEQRDRGGLAMRSVHYARPDVAIALLPQQ